MRRQISAKRELRRGSYVLLVLVLTFSKGVWANPTDEATRKGVETSIVENVMSRFKSRLHISEKDGATYDNVERFKAGAACLRWDSRPKEPALVTYWGASWEYDSQLAANENAIGQCKKAFDEGPYGSKGRYSASDLGCTCELIIEGSEVRLKPPSEEVNKIIENLKPENSFPTICKKWLQVGEISIPWNVDSSSDEQCKTYDSAAITRYDFPIERIENPSKSSAPEIYPGAPSVLNSAINTHDILGGSEYEVAPHLKFSPPEGKNGSQTPFTLPHGWRYKYSLHRLPLEAKDSFKARLDALDGGRMYGKFKPGGQQSAQSSKLSLATEFAQYIRSFDLKSSPDIIETLDYGLFPEDTLLVAKGERSRKIWFVSTVPVNKDWIPMGPPLRSIVPLALETTAALYLYAAEVESTFRWRNSAGGNTLGRVNTI